ncbi:MAG: TonB-dependent receptor [Bacteroidales bacterium]|nr:TonB-dependent receptor [Bacteroidales bacterium]
MFNFLLLLLPAGLFAQVLDTVQHSELDEVTIEFMKPTNYSAGNVSVISGPQVRAQQGNGSVNNLLDMMPGMITTSDAGNGLGATYMRLRGIDQTRINTTLNGVTINNAESQGTWLVNLPDMGTFIEQVSVQSGANTTAGSTSYGGRINFMTRDIPNKPFAELKADYGSFNTFHTAISAGTGLINNRFSLLASFSDIRSDGYVDWSAVRLNSGFMTAKLKLFNFKKNKDYGLLKFHFLHGSEISGLSWNGVPYELLETNRTYNDCGLYYTDNNEERYYADSKDHYTQRYYQLEYEKKWFRGYNTVHELKVMPYVTRGYGYYQQYKDDKKISKYGLLPLVDSVKYSDFITQKWMDNFFYGLCAQYSGTKTFNKHSEQGLHWIAGVDVNNYNGQHYGNVIWSQPGRVQDFPCDYRWYDGTGDKLQSKAFANLRYWYKSFTITAELQYRNVNYAINGTNDEMMDVTQQYNWNFINPKIDLHYLLRKGKLTHSFDLSFATANREATRDDIILAPDDRKPVPESLLDLEFSYMVYGEKFFFNTTLYGMNYKNQLVRTGELDQTGDALMANVPKSFRAGIELSAAYRPVKFFTWHVNGCFSMNRILDYVHYVDHYSGEYWDWDGQVEQHLGNTPISFSPSVVLGNDFTFTPLKDFNISFITKFVSKQYLDNSGDDTYCLKPFSYSNLRISYTFHFPKVMKDLELFLNVNNIFNAKYESNAWIYTSYYEDEPGKYYSTGYFPQAGINLLGGVRIKF